MAVHLHDDPHDFDGLEAENPLELAGRPGRESAQLEDSQLKNEPVDKGCATRVDPWMDPPAVILRLRLALAEVCDAAEAALVAYGEPECPSSDADDYGDAARDKIDDARRILNRSTLSGIDSALIDRIKVQTAESVTKMVREAQERKALDRIRKAIYPDDPA